MPGKTYNAGTIFLQVVPVFGDVQNAIRRQAKDINASLGDELEEGGRQAGERAGKGIADGIEKSTKRSGEKAGREYGSAFEKQVADAVKSAQKAIDGMDFKTASDKSLADLERVRRILKELGDTEIDFNSKKALAQLAVLEGTIEGLVKGDHEIEITANLLQARKDLKKIGLEADRIANEAREIKIGAVFETKQAERAMGAFEKRVRDTARKAASHLGDSVSPAIRKIKEELEGLADAEIGIDISSAEARAKLDALEQKLRELSLHDTNIDVKLDTGKAYADLAVLTTALDAVDGRDIDIKVDVDAGAAAAKLGFLRGMFGAGSGGAEAAANSFRSFNVVVLAAVTLLPALIPVIGAVGGALLGLLPILSAVGAGFAAMLVGFSGIGDAVGALGEVTDNAAKDASAANKTLTASSYAVADARTALADAERNAARAQIDAARAVADARRAAADAIEDALDRQRDAQEAYRDSVQDVREAEAALRDARKQAAAEQESTQDRIRQNRLDIREALLGAFDATNTFNAVMADGSSTAYDKEAAEVAMLQARERLHELREERKELRDKAKEGVKNSETVKTAEEALADAIERQREAQEALGEAAEAVAEARIEGARNVARAVEAQQRAEEDGARSVARAQEQLRRAQEAHQQALYETGEIGSASMQKLEEAMGKLGPAGRRFARFLFGLRDSWYEFRRAVQEAMLPGVQRGLDSLISTYGPQFTAFMAEMGGVVGGFFESFSDSLQGEAWRKFFGVMEDLGPLMAAQFGETTINWLEAFASLMTAVAPWAERMSLAMLGISEAVADWAASEKGQQAITRFMEYADRIGGPVIEFLGAFVDAAVNLARAMAPWGEVVLKGLTALLDFIAEMDPQQLGIIVGAILTMIIAWQAAVGAVAAFYGGMSAFATKGGRLIFGILGVVGILIILYTQFEAVRDIMDSFFDFIGDHLDLLSALAGVVLAIYGAFKLWTIIMGIYTTITVIAASVTGIFYLMLLGLVAVFALVVIGLVILYKKNETFRRVVDAVWGAVKKAIEVAWNVIKKVIEFFGDAVTWLWKTIIKPYLGAALKFWGSVFRGMKLIWNNILWPVIDLIGTLIWRLFKHYFGPALDNIAETWDKVMRGLKWVWTNVLRPVWEIMKQGLDRLKDRFSDTVGGIESIWDKLRRIIGAPIKFVIETVLNNGLIKGFNKVAEFVGSDPMKPLPVPEWTYAEGGIFGRRKTGYATGGVMPGYTPGRDVHQFYSPTAGRLNLSGGEAVMRPEFTKAVGPGFVDQMNAAARAGGVNAVRRMLGTERSYWLGGVLPLLGAKVDRHDSGYDGYAADMNYGSGYDDYGLGVRAWKAGQAYMTYWGDQSYGRFVDIDHGNGQTSKYAHLSGFAAGLKQGMRVAAGQIIGYVGDVGNTGNPPTSHLHFEINGGSIDTSDTSGMGGGGDDGGFPFWMLGAIRNPGSYIGDAIREPLTKLTDTFNPSRMLNIVKAVPEKLVRATANKLAAILPGPNPQGSVVGEALDNVVPGGIPGLATGGIYGRDVHYNGTMMYDAGGYLPPGITQVVNLTGKPEPVFTNDQFEGMKSDGKGGWTYAPTFNASDLTSEDVMEDFEFTVRKLDRQRGGRYEEHTS